MCKPIAGIHLLAGWVRGRSAEVQTAAINELMNKNGELGGYSEQD